MASGLPQAPGGLNERAVLHRQNASIERRLLGSLASVDKPTLAKVAEHLDERTKRERARLAAQADLANILRQQPRIYEALGLISLGRSSTDAELLRAFGLVDSMNKALRMAGTGPADVATAMKLATIAYQPPEPPEPKSEEEQQTEMLLERGRWLLLLVWVFGGVTIVMAIVLFIMACVKLIEKAAWIYGSCEIVKFSAGHGDCSDRDCAFDLHAWKQEERHKRADTAKQVFNWRLPLVEENGVLTTSVQGEAFRCCNNDPSFHCCGFYDFEFETYCDAWMYKTDRRGQPCPETPWLCRFQYVSGSEEIEKLEAIHDDATIWLLVGPAIGIGSLSVAIFSCTACSGCRQLIGRFGAWMRGICEGRDHKESIWELEEARLETMDPALRKAEERNLMRKDLIRPPTPLPQTPPRPGSAAKQLRPVSAGSPPGSPPGSPQRGPSRRLSEALREGAWGIPGETNAGETNPKGRSSQLVRFEDELPRPMTTPGLGDSPAKGQEVSRPGTTPSPSQRHTSNRAQRKKDGQKEQLWAHSDASQGRWQVVDL